MVSITENKIRQYYKLYLSFKNAIIHSSLKSKSFFIRDIDIMNDSLWWVKTFDFIVSENVFQVIYPWLPVHLSNL